MPRNVETDRKCDQERLLELALSVRNFEIELVWKRATYFWGIQLVFGTMIAIVITGNKVEGSNLLVFILMAFGALMSLINYLSFRGSKYWQDAWEHKLHVLDEASQHSRRLFVDYSPVRRHFFGAGDWSVSKLAALANLSMLVFWLALMVWWVDRERWLQDAAGFLGLILAVLVVGMLGLVAMLCCKTTWKIGLKLDGEYIPASPSKRPERPSPKEFDTE